VFEAEGGNARVLDPAGATSGPSWSADGTRIIYTNPSGSQIIGADGGTTRTIDLQGASIFQPNWSRSQ
jgi:Tol biopolymer transport system component